MQLELGAVQKLLVVPIVDDLLQDGFFNLIDILAALSLINSLGRLVFDTVTVKAISYLSLRQLLVAVIR